MLSLEKVSKAATARRAKPVHVSNGHFGVGLPTVGEKLWASFVQLPPSTSPALGTLVAEPASLSVSRLSPGGNKTIGTALILPNLQQTMWSQCPEHSRHPLKYISLHPESILSAVYHITGLWKCNWREVSPSCTHHKDGFRSQPAARTHPTAPTAAQHPGLLHRPTGLHGDPRCQQKERLPINPLTETFIESEQKEFIWQQTHPFLLPVLLIIYGHIQMSPDVAIFFFPVAVAFILMCLFPNSWTFGISMTMRFLTGFKAMQMLILQGFWNSIPFFPLGYHNEIPCVCKFWSRTWNRSPGSSS